MDDHGTSLQLKLGQAARLRRVELGYSQDSFADVIGMQRAYYSAIERGERNMTLQTLARVAAGLQVKLAKLMTSADL
jgi:transcriptional regulator with XRE-family HTH domain